MTALDVVWFRRDLRLHDNPVLDAAGDRPIVPLFVVDPALLGSKRMGAPRLAYLADALADLDAALAALGGRLVVRRGDPADVVPRVAAETGATRVRWTGDISPYAKRRDAEVARRLRSDGVECDQVEGVFMQPPGTVTNAAGEPYRVFTPFYKAWRQREVRQTIAPTRKVHVPGDVQSDPVPTRVDLAGELTADVRRGGETAARHRLEQFVSQRAADYHERRDLLAVDGTSRISADLHYGCLSVAEVYHRLDLSREGDQAFARELAFRDFYGHVLDAFPDVLTTEFNPRMRSLPWHGDGEDFQAWVHGRTGYPVVDAAMRQLAGEAWMHNRGRMIVASFLCKHLLIDWRLGEAHFLRGLVDGDLANNNGGWQWAAGTGTDAQPYFRIFNPVTQGRRFDPDGAYVRRWCPELTDLPDKWLHAPWEMPDSEAASSGIRVGEDYPSPVVDHGQARQRALAWFDEHRQPADSR